MLSGPKSPDCCLCARILDHARFAQFPLAYLVETMVLNLR